MESILGQKMENTNRHFTEDDLKEFLIWKVKGLICEYKNYHDILKPSEQFGKWLDTIFDKAIEQFKKENIK